MQLRSILACASLAVLLGACGYGTNQNHADNQGRYYDNNNGYYDQGYRSAAEINDTSTQSQRHAPDSRNNPAAPGDYRSDYRDMGEDRSDRNGYNDVNHAYNPNNVAAINIPNDMLPRRGMCRIWYVNRMQQEQPAPQSCHGIQHHVPAGAFVVYGG